jgi:hypothetical protein
LGFPTKNLYALVLFPTHVTCPTHLILDLITQIMILYHCKFRQKLPNTRDPNMTTIYRHVKRVWATGSILDRKRSGAIDLLTEEKLEIGLTCTANEHVCVIGMNCNKTEASNHTRPLWFTNIMTDKDIYKNFKSQCSLCFIPFNLHIQ